MQQTTKESFADWCIIELMGHQRIAGYVTEETIAGAALLRVDVPECPGHTAYTRYIGSSAVYALTPVSEEVARAAAASFRPRPVDRWELPALPAAQSTTDEEYG